MSAFDLPGFLAGAWYRVNRLVVLARRTGPGPAIVRLFAGAAAAGAFLLATPSTLGSAQAGLLVPMALAVALFPRSWVVSAAAVVTVGLWLTSSAGSGPVVPLWRVGLMGLLLYGMHAAASLAAALPYDASMRLRLLLTWGVHHGAIAVVSVGAILVVLAGAERLAPHRSVVGALVGVVLAAALAAVLAAQLRRRDP